MECARMLKLGNLTEHLEELLHQAQEKQLTYPEFLLACLREEVRTRENRKYLCRLKAAGLPARHDLDRYDFTRTEGIDSRKLRELRELVWVGQAYNLLLAGGSGTGKTYIAAGLVHEAVKNGYRASAYDCSDVHREGLGSGCDHHENGDHSDHADCCVFLIEFFLFRLCELRHISGIRDHLHSDKCVI